ncbi:ECF-type sigma factor [Janibacter melonis]|uniref:ECF-type sigma factor n=1 Tax=Janibacter melonis TaxID=262209 RepID=UPI001CD8C23A
MTRRGGRTMTQEMVDMVVTFMDDEDPRAALRGGAELRRGVKRREAVLVRRARSAGLSWAEIAHELGVSRQAVHRKYGGSRFERARST